MRNDHDEDAKKKKTHTKKTVRNQESLGPEHDLVGSS